MEYESLTELNIQKVHELFNINEAFYYIPLDYFKKGTLEDEDFDPDLTLILNDPQKEYPIAALIAVNRENNCCIKVFIMDNAFRRQGIGSNMLKELINRAKDKDIPLMSYGDCPPNYWQPGVDLRHTSLYFLLKKFRFKPRDTRYNLTAPLAKLNIQPLSEKEGFTFERVRPEEFEVTYSFVKNTFPRNPSWAEELKLSYERSPPTSFIAKNEEGQVIGWASHSVQFPGSFGPTGVKFSLHGQGIGGELLNWCLWDIKQLGLENCTIMWVNGQTIKFYSKTIGAYIHPVFTTMSKKLRKK